MAAEYGYVHGDILGGSGHLRVKVSESKVTVDYVPTAPTGKEDGPRQDGQIGHTYAVIHGR